MDDVIVQETVTTTQRGRVKQTKVKKTKKRDFTVYLFDWIVKGALVAMLLCAEFIVFADSANNNLLTAPMAVSASVLSIVIGIVIFSFLSMFLISFSSILQNLFVSVVVGIFTIMFLSHFALFDYSSFLYGSAEMILGATTALKLVGTSHYIFAALLGLIVFIFLCFSRESTIAYFVGVVLLIFGSIVFNKYMNFQDKPEYKVVFENPNGEEKEKPRKFIYIAVPNLASYNFLEGVKDGEDQPSDKLDKLMSSMLGFYAKNGFVMYPNAYVNDDNPFRNMVRTLNLTSDDDIEQYFLYGVNLSSYFSFNGINDVSMFLRENKLVSTFKKNNYKITTYQSRGLDLCRENNNIVSDKCVSKQNIPVDMKNLSLTTGQKAKVLFAQWIETSGLIKDYGKIYSLLDVATDASSAPVVGVPYSKLYVVDSFTTLDKLAEDIISDKSNRAYFAFMDLPSDMYVYSEFCKPKNPSFWTTMDNLPWVNKNNLYKKRNAYFDQATCFYGKLEEFMQKLHASDVADRAVIVIQGLNSAKGLKNNKAGNYMEDFKNDKLVGMAIRDPLKKQFSVNANACNAADVLNGYLFNKDGACDELKGVPLQEGAKNDLIGYLKQTGITKNKVVAARDAFNEWHKDWARFNNTQLPEKPKAEPEKKKDWIEDISDLEVEEVAIKEAPKVAAPLVEEKPEAEVKSLSDATEEAAAEEAQAEEVEEKTDVATEVEEVDSNVDVSKEVVPSSSIVVEDDIIIQTIEPEVPAPVAPPPAEMVDSVEIIADSVPSVADEPQEPEQKLSVDDILNDILSDESEASDEEVEDVVDEKVNLLRAPEEAEEIIEEDNGVTIFNLDE